MVSKIVTYVAVASIGYLLGSCPNGLLVGRALGVDLRHHGSGNIGATNALRVLGKKWGYLVFALDALKGLCSVLIASIFNHFGSESELIGIVGGLACILGHTYPVWLAFRGGKGVATSAGVLLGLMPLAMLSVLAVWWLLFKTTRYVSVSSVGAAITLPLFVFVYLRSNIITGASLLPFSAVIAGVVVWRHRSNLRRLINGTEQRFGHK